MSRNTKRVLFVCVRNAGRSQMAAAIFNALVRQRGLDWVAESAGSVPADRVQPEVVAAMAEVGIDLSDARPRAITDEQVAAAARVITMGCELEANSCPAILLKNVEDWGLPDPRGRPLAEVRTIREEIRRRVEALLDELTKQS